MTGRFVLRDRGRHAVNVAAVDGSFQALRDILHRLALASHIAVGGRADRDAVTVTVVHACTGGEVDGFGALGDFGCTANCTADVNGDGTVTVQDLLDGILANFGTACP